MNSNGEPSHHTFFPQQPSMAPSNQTNTPTIRQNDQSKGAAISIPVIFGVLSIVLTIASITLAYLQLRHLYRVHGSGESNRFPHSESGINHPFRLVYEVKSDWNLDGAILLRDIEPLGLRSDSEPLSSYPQQVPSRPRITTQHERHSAQNSGAYHESEVIPDTSASEVEVFLIPNFPEPHVID